jgi:hypothetical protein
VYSFGTTPESRSLPRAAEGDPRMFGSWGVYLMPMLRGADDPVARDGRTLLEFFQEQTDGHAQAGGPSNLRQMSTQAGSGDRCQMSTQAGKRRGLLIGRTELGVALGKPAIAVVLALDEGWQPVREISGKTGLSGKHTYKILIKKLAPLGLAQSDLGEWVKQGTRQVWKAGIPVEECRPDPLPDVVGARLRRWEAERQGRKEEFPTAAELEEKFRAMR